MGTHSLVIAAVNGYSAPTPKPMTNLQKVSQADIRIDGSPEPGVPKLVPIAP